MAALIEQTPVLIDVYLLISLLFSVVLLVTSLFRSYKLILLINIYQSQCQCVIQNQLRISMFIQPVSVNHHIFFMWHIYYYNIHFVNTFVTVLFNSPHIFDQIHQSAHSSLQIYVYVLAHHSHQPSHTRILLVVVIIPSLLMIR